VLLRGDGRATYNLAVVVDDVGQRISHVIRGAGHLSNTHKQALLFDALDHPRPVFAHLPTVLGPDGQPLSKRQRSQSVAQLREDGYHPGGVVNYLSLLGWSSPDGREVFARDELIARTSLDRLGAADATALDPEKLRWMSAQHIAAMELDELVGALSPWLAGAGVPERSVTPTVAALRTRLHRFGEIGEHLGLIHPPDAALDQARAELRSDAAVAPVLAAVRDRLAAEPSWEAGPLGEAVRAAGKEAGAGGPRLFHPVRRALTAATSGPDLGQVLAALGREVALARLAAAIPEV
jgi:glutamyl/glutaminyl-tRNA synthetase